MKTLAILTADIHLSHTPPRMRAVEDCWYTAMRRPLEQLDNTSLTRNMVTRIPIIYAGDIFHKWNSPPELVNFALQHLPPGYAIPGQHDLPYHRYADIKKSAFWTLVEAKKIVLLEPGTPLTIPGKVPLTVYAFPYGSPVKANRMPSIGLDIAVVHSYIWKQQEAYWQAPQDGYFANYPLEGYHAAVFGDNHNHFSVQHKGCLIWNCGAVMRRSLADLSRSPCLGLLKEDGTIERRCLDCKDDKTDIYVEDSPAGDLQAEVSNFLMELTRVAEHNTDEFDRLLKQLLESKTVKQVVKDIIIKAMGEGT